MFLISFTTNYLCVCKNKDLPDLSSHQKVLYIYLSVHCNGEYKAWHTITSSSWNTLSLKKKLHCPIMGTVVLLFGQEKYIKDVHPIPRKTVLNATVVDKRWSKIKKNYTHTFWSRLQIHGLNLRRLPFFSVTWLAVERSLSKHGFFTLTAEFKIEPF